MPCRAGITTNRDVRKRAHARRFAGFRSWRVVAGPFHSREAAQAWETAYCRRSGCIAHRGGRSPDDLNALWWGYRFTYDRDSGR